MNDSKSKLEQIRTLLDEIECNLGTNEEAIFSHNFDALELPSIVASVVDFLQPLLHPYEAALYWYFFRNSLILTGQQYVRASTRGLQQGVIRSSSGQGDTLSYSSVQQALTGLEEKRIISKAGETNREGTLYKIFLPEEIEICQKLMSLKEQDIVKPVDEQKELDYYNVQENRLQVFERDGYKCHYCNKQLTRFTATLDHIQPVSEGGDNSYLNLTTACLHCNSRRGSRPVMEMYQS
jgi:hypothetical protein